MHAEIYAKRDRIDGDTSRGHPMRVQSDSLVLEAKTASASDQTPSDAHLLEITATSTKTLNHGHDWIETTLTLKLRPSEIEMIVAKSLEAKLLRMPFLEQMLKAKEHLDQAVRLLSLYPKSK